MKKSVSDPSIPKVSIVEPGSRLAAAEALLASTQPDRQRERAEIEAAQADLAPYATMAADALAQLGRVLAFHDNEALLNLATRIEWDALRMRRGLDEAERIRAQRFVRDTNSLVSELRDRLTRIPGRVANLSYEDLAPMNFDGEPWNGNRPGRYPVEPGRIKRHVLQLVRDVAALSQRFDDLGRVVESLRARLAKYSSDTVNDRAVHAIPPEELERRRAMRPGGEQRVADSHFSGYERDNQ